MASISTDAKGNRRIVFTNLSGKRDAIYGGKLRMRDAETIATKIEALLSAKSSRRPIEPDLAEWVADVPDWLAEKLADKGLIARRVKDSDVDRGTLLGEFLTDHLARRSDLKGTSLVVYEHVQRNLEAFFGKDKPLREITEGDAVDFGRYLAAGKARRNKSGEKLSRTTVDRRMSLATTIFNDAVRHRLVAGNPFNEWRKPLKNVISRTNKARQRFINQDDFARIVAKAPDAEWRLLLALARFGGMRVPSEPLSLKWSDVDWEQNQIRVPCPKLEHIEGRESRIVPIFHELRSYLEECWDAAETGAVWIIAKHRPLCVRNGDGWRGANLRTMLHKIIRRAGFEPWPRAWNNLRASRATELAEDFPGHVAAAWLGHTEEIANAHYRQVLPSHFEKATRIPTRALSEMPETEGNSVVRPMRENEKAPEFPGLSVPCMLVQGSSGGGGGTRTHDLRIKSPLLYQLSYTSKVVWSNQS